MRGKGWQEQDTVGWVERSETQHRSPTSLTNITYQHHAPASMPTSSVHIVEGNTACIEATGFAALNLPTDLQRRRCNLSTPPQGETRIDARPEFVPAFSQPIREPVETPPV
jgi:hypothetical protein